MIYDASKYANRGGWGANKKYSNIHTSRYVLDEYTASRRQLLVRSFVDALTVGGPGGTPRPIELHAHDPPRYVGDMLAWLHQGRLLDFILLLLTFHKSSLLDNSVTSLQKYVTFDLVK